MSMLANHNAISAGGYTIQRSLRFRQSASAYLNRTFGTPTNAIKWTVSCWIKRGTISSIMDIFGSYVNTSTYGAVDFLASNQLSIYATNSVAWLITNNVFRDPSAWYHLVVRYDSANATASNRVNIYINGVECSYATDNRASYQNQASGWNRSGTSNGIGAGLGSINGYFDGYIAEFYHVDGQALTPSEFGQTDPVTGVWTAKKYTGTYGNNGFYLPFTDTSSTTNLVKDSSGNNNNWTPNNISLTAGVTYDSMIDSPTITASGTQPVGNYCVWNPLSIQSSMTITNANLTTQNTGTVARTTIGTIGVTSGKHYWEMTAFGVTLIYVGVCSSQPAAGGYIGDASTGWAYNSAGQKVNSASAVSYGATYTSNDVIGVALDMDAGTLTFYKNGATQGQAYTGITGLIFPAMSTNGVAGNGFHANFGQQPFAYTPPTGFKALCTTNLPDSTIVKGNQYMDATLWTGNDANPRSITGLNFNPDLVWIKSRSNAQYHVLNDSVRGAGTSKALASQLTDAEGSAIMGLYGAVTAFNSDGFSVGGGTSNQAFVNFLNYTYVGWAWDAGSSTVTNTSGTISSQVRANTTAGVSIVTYTGTGANATVGHGLGVAPKMIITKGRDSVVGATNWSVYHASIGNTQRLVLNSTAAAATVATAWNNTSPTSTVFSIGTNGDLNGSTATYVAYCFAEIAGFSRFGSYTGNGSADGPFVFTNFQPKFVMIKRTDTTGNWTSRDTARDSINGPNGNGLFPNLADAETASLSIDYLSNGFKIRDTGAFNTSSATYIYMAFATNPFKVSNAR